MHKLLGALVAAALAGTAQLALAFGPLMEPEAVAGGSDSGNGVTILDIRAAEAFSEGHIAGAVNTPYGLFRGPQENPGRVPEAAALQEVLRAAGAAPERPVLIAYEGASQSDFGAAARVYWTLKSAGFESLAILNGGMVAYGDVGGSLTTEAVAPEPSDMVLTFRDDWWIDRDGVDDVVAGRSDAVLLDARPADFFRGETKHGAASVAGTLAGALNLVHASWFPSGGTRIEEPAAMIAEVQTIAASKGGAPLVSFCNTGHWAATNWFAASELAGIEGVKLYPESMVGWTLFGGATVSGH